MTTEEINLSGRFVKLDGKALFAAFALVAGGVWWCADTTNKLQSLTTTVSQMALRMDGFAKDQYSEADAVRDFAQRDQRLIELQGRLYKLEESFREEVIKQQRK